MRARGLSASRIRQAYRLLSGMMTAAVQAGYLAKSPCIGIRLPRMVRRDASLLTASEVDRLAEAVAQPGRKKHASAPKPATLEQQATLIYLLAYGGLRWGEAAALRRKRCDLLHGRVEVAERASDVNGRLVYGPTKTYERRWVRLPVFLSSGSPATWRMSKLTQTPWSSGVSEAQPFGTRASAEGSGMGRWPERACPPGSRRIACGTLVPASSWLAVPTPLPSSATSDTRT
jgi:hypothetical protein